MPQPRHPRAIPYGARHKREALRELAQDSRNYRSGYGLPTPLFLSRAADAVKRMPTQGEVTIPQRDNTPLRLARSLVWMAATAERIESA